MHIRLSEVVAALSYALDITEGQPEGHANRACLIGMRIARLAGVSQTLYPALYYALLLKDLGCSSNAARVCELFAADDLAAKRDMKLTDWSSLPAAAIYGLQHTAPQGSPLERAARMLAIGLQGGPLAARGLFAVRCHRGAQIALDLGFPAETAQAIQSLDEHWNGRGYPDGLRGERIPLLSRILCLAQSIEIFYSTYGLEAARAMAQRRRGRWFDPALVDLLDPLWADLGLWHLLSGADARAAVAAISPDDRLLDPDDTLLDRLAEAFAQVIDAKSPWTYSHSTGVAEKAVGIGTVLGLGHAALRDLRRAALLHDIGKLGISNRILDKPGRLSDAEMDEMRLHPIYTRRILERVSAFAELAYAASLHHERLDGRGYPYGLSAAELPQTARILAVADVCDALCAARPYREPLPWRDALAIMEQSAGSGLCPASLGALRRFLEARETQGGLLGRSVAADSQS